MVTDALVIMSDAALTETPRFGNVARNSHQEIGYDVSL
jgi:hypothetical protein